MARDHNVNELSGALFFDEDNADLTLQRKSIFYEQIQKGTHNSPMRFYCNNALPTLIRVEGVEDGTVYALGLSVVNNWSAGVEEPPKAVADLQDADVTLSMLKSYLSTLDFDLETARIYDL